MVKLLHVHIQSTALVKRVPKRLISDVMVEDVLITGLADEDIMKDVLGWAGQNLIKSVCKELSPSLRPRKWHAMHSQSNLLVLSQLTEKRKHKLILRQKFIRSAKNVRGYGEVYLEQKTV